MPARGSPFLATPDNTLPRWVYGRGVEERKFFKIMKETTPAATTAKTCGRTKIKIHSAKIQTLSMRMSLISWQTSLSVSLSVSVRLFLSV